MLLPTRAATALPTFAVSIEAMELTPLDRGGITAIWVDYPYHTIFNLNDNNIFLKKMSRLFTHKYVL